MRYQEALRLEKEQAQDKATNEESEKILLELNQMIDERINDLYSRGIDPYADIQKRIQEESSKGNIITDPSLAPPLDTPGYYYGIEWFINKYLMDENKEEIDQILKESAKNILDIQQEEKRKEYMAKVFAHRHQNNPK